MLTTVKEGFRNQLKIVFDKLKEAENKPCKSPQDVNQSKYLAMPNLPAADLPEIETTTAERQFGEVHKTRELAVKKYLHSKQRNEQLYASVN